MSLSGVSASYSACVSPINGTESFHVASPNNALPELAVPEPNLALANTPDVILLAAKLGIRAVANVPLLLS